MIHKGKLLEKKIRASNKSLKAISDELGVSRTTIYRWFEEPDLSTKYFRQVSEIIGYPFTDELPELAMEVRDDLAEYIASDTKCHKLLQERNKYLDLYVHLQQEHNELNKKVLELSTENRMLEKQLTILRQKIA